MPKLTYKPKTADDPPFVTVGSHRFEANKGLDVSDETHARLKNNPWFSGGREAKERAEELSQGGSNVVGQGESAINLSPPPGSGMKTDPGGVVATGEGLVPVEDASDVDGANVVEEKDAARKGRRDR